MDIDIEELKKRLREGAQFYHAPTTWNEAANALEAMQERIRVLEQENAELFGRCVDAGIEEMAKQGRVVVNKR